MEAESITIPIEKEKNLRRSLVFYIKIKGIMSRLAAIVMIIILSPILLLISAAIRLDSPGNPLFAQKRVGEKGRNFTAYKFRTMRINNDDSAYRLYLEQYILQNAPYKIKNNGEPVFKLVDDPRITRIGALLRKSNLDELPQLLNIIKGEMVFIGPRPDIPFSVSMYRDWHYRRLEIKPGITGLWQVAHRKNLNFDDMVRLDIQYIEQQSLPLDLKILLMTVKTIFTGDGS